MIRLGDELLSVNGVSLVNMSFDDIIASHVAAEAGPGEPLKLRFRPVPMDRVVKTVLLLFGTPVAKVFRSKFGMQDQIRRHLSYKLLVPSKMNTSDMTTWIQQFRWRHQSWIPSWWSSAF
jgi:hypothetical protein